MGSSSPTTSTTPLLINNAGLSASTPNSFSFLPVSRSSPPQVSSRSTPCYNSYVTRVFLLFLATLFLLLGLLYVVVSTVRSQPPAKLVSPPEEYPSRTTNGQNINKAETNCRLPRLLDNRKIINFKPPSYTKLRVRPAAHLVDEAYVAKYKKAISLMKELPPNDPRSFYQQANIHAAYCTPQGFDFFNISAFQIHRTWLFFPFHRYLLYFFERILGKLINDTHFALPFWNYDSPQGMQMPPFYTNDNTSSLYDPLRNHDHFPPKLAILNYNQKEWPLSDEELISYNLKTIHRQMFGNGKVPSLFFGGPQYGSIGSVESAPHNTLHTWCGRLHPNKENMGYFYSAARDPIFYSHHSNIDRLWTVWKTLGGKRRDITDPDWLDSGLNFFDENGDLVHVKVKDCLDTKNLGYVYQEVDIPWLKEKPAPRTRDKAEPSKMVFTNIDNIKFPIVLMDKKVTVLVKRGKTSRSEKEKKEEEEVLVIEGIEYERDMGVKFDVYVNDEGDDDDDEETKPDITTQFAGSFVSVPDHKHSCRSSHQSTESDHHKKRSVTTTNANLRLGLTDLLEDLGAEDEESLALTLVPRNGVVSIRGLKIEYVFV